MTTRFVTQGCRLNAWETEAMSGLASRAGVTGTVVVNTCAVTAEAVRKARQEVRAAARQQPGARIVVTGCAAQTEPAGFAAMPEVTHVMGNAEKLEAPTWDALAPGFIGPVPRLATGGLARLRTAATPPVDGAGQRARAYVQVQNGCDHRCTFCIIPYGRGASRSVPAATVVDQVARLRDAGFREVVLTGVDLTSWGGDLDGTPRLGDLVRSVLRAAPDLARLRLSSIDSIEADPALMEALATEPRLMPHLHLSLQAGDDLILKRMKRRHLREDAVRFCETARTLRPGIALGADLIAGFPTETEAMAERTRALVADCGLAWLHVFPFSARAGTPAARMPALDGATIRERARCLRAEGTAARDRFLARQIGTVQAVLMETPRRGRTETFAEVEFATDHAVGTIVTARIAGHAGGRLVAV